MRDKPYYSQRSGKNTGKSFDFPSMRSVCVAIYLEFDQRGCFQEFHGKDCVDGGNNGKIRDLENHILGEIRKADLWPIKLHAEHYAEDDLFDILEFLHDTVSKPLEGSFHSHADCGWHYSTFDQGAGQAEFRGRVNRVLKDYGDGFELSADGLILTLSKPGLSPLLEGPAPGPEDPKVGRKVEAAIQMFRSSRNSVEDRRSAVVVLAGVLEHLRPLAKRILHRKDESNLFDLANNYSVRHQDASQKTEYDENIWLDWMFYYYLGTIHALVRLAEKAGLAV